MRSILKYPLIVVLLSTVCIESNVAQDWHKINPDGTKILIDTTLLRAVKVTIEPGETIGPVTHPTNFAYILDKGKLRVYFENEEPKLMNLKKGMPLYSSPEGPHRTENIGDRPVSFLIVELKEHPYQKKADK